MLGFLAVTWFTSSFWSAIAAGLAAFAALFSLRTTREVNNETKRREARALEIEFQDRRQALFAPLVDRVPIDDDIVPEDRKLFMPMFHLYASIWLAHHDGLLSEEDWHSHHGHFFWYMSRPECRRVWMISSTNYPASYHPRFVSFVNDELNKFDSAGDDGG